MGLSAAHYLAIDHPWISNRRMPIYRCTFPAAATTDELQGFFHARDVWAARVRYHFAWVFDLSKITKAPATHRKALAEHIKRHEEFSARWNAGAALVVPSPWLRGLVTAVFWVSPPKYPHETFAETLEAERWARKQLDRRLAELS